MKDTKQVIDWTAYNRALVARGNVTIWFSASALKKWQLPKTGSKGRPIYFSDLAIETCLTIKSVFRLPLRATEGFVQSLVAMLKRDLRVPNYSTLSKRAKGLKIELKSFSNSESYDLVVDSTGVKLYGEGEWKVRTHGKSKRRKWMKLHLAIDPATHQIMSAAVTNGSRNDGKTLPKLLKNHKKKLKKVYADGAYNGLAVRQQIIKHGGKPVIPPRKNAAKSLFPKSRAERERSDSVGRIRRIGRKNWKKEVGYHQRSLAETGMFRLKTLTGERVSARKKATIEAELLIRCNILNQMAALGMPCRGATI